MATLFHEIGSGTCLVYAYRMCAALLHLSLGLLR